MNIVVKYCGGCNCQIDRSQIIRDIESSLTNDCQITTDLSGAPLDAGILICGCPSACARKPELDDIANRWVVIAGKTIDSRELPEQELAASAIQEIKKMKDGGI